MEVGVVKKIDIRICLCRFFMFLSNLVTGFSGCRNPSNDSMQIGCPGEIVPQVCHEVLESLACDGGLS